MKIMELEYNEAYFFKNIENNSIVMLDPFKRNKIFNNKYDYEFFSSDFAITQTSQSNVKSIFIILTTECNLNCSYCFEKGIKKEILGENKIQPLLSFIEQWVGESKVLEVVFTGGEPLLNYNLLKKLTVILDSKYDTKFSLISNGTLVTKKFIKFFNKFKFSIQLTLDGWKDNHNKQRSNETIKNSYFFLLKITSYLLQFQNIKITIRVNINNINKNDIIRIIDDYRQIILNNNFKIYFDFIDVNEESNLYLSLDDKLKLLFKTYYMLSKLNKKIPYQYILGGNCQIRNKNSITINSNLNIYNCYSLVGEESLGVPINKIHELYKDEYICSNTNCFYYHLCEGGCTYKSKVKYSKLKVDCNYFFLNEINKYIFILELYIMNKISLYDALKNYKKISLYDISSEENKYVEINKYC